jgi:VWFA-related protein
MRSAVLLVLVATYGQQVTIEPRVRAAPKDSATRAPNLRIDTNLVLVPVTVTDQAGRPVLGLEKENFRVQDNRVEQTVLQLAMEDDPVAVGFVFDVSGSIGTDLTQYRLAAHQFFKFADEQDEFFLVVFRDSPTLAVPLTRNAGSIDYQIMMTKSQGWTALFDAVYMGTNEIRKSALIKKALIVISDGGENHSRYRLSELENALRETDALLYAIGPGPSSQGGGLLKHLAEFTGGRLIQYDGSRIEDLAQKIIVDLRNRYVISYAPKDVQRDGKYHDIHVQLLAPKGMGKLTAHWRKGYYAPAQ